MQVKQISKILNNVFGEVIGDTAIVAEDLSNIVSVGNVITGSDTFADNFENYAGKIIDKVGKTVFADRAYRAKDLGIWRDSFEYGSVLEKLRVDVGDYEDNCEWDLTKMGQTGLDYNENIQNHIEELFSFTPASVQAKYFNMMTTFKTKISLTRKQLRSAFQGATEMARFIGMIENRIMSKMEIAKEELARRAIVNFIGEKIASNSNVVDLKAEFEAAGGAVINNMSTALANPDFLRFAAKRITMDREFMTQPSKIYNTGSFYTHTPEADARLIVLSDLDKGLAFNLYGDTYHTEFVRLDGYKTTPFWQGTGLTMAIGDRSKLSIKTASGETVNETGILGILFDRDGIMACNETPEVRTQRNEDGNFTNFWYCYDASFYNDLDENGIVYTWGTTRP